MSDVSCDGGRMGLGRLMKVFVSGLEIGNLKFHKGGVSGVWIRRIGWRPFETWGNRKLEI